MLHGCNTRVTTNSIWLISDESIVLNQHQSTPFNSRSPSTCILFLSSPVRCWALCRVGLTEGCSSGWSTAPGPPLRSPSWSPGCESGSRSSSRTSPAPDVTTVCVTGRAERWERKAGQNGSWQDMRAMREQHSQWAPAWPPWSSCCPQSFSLWLWRRLWACNRKIFNSHRHVSSRGRACYWCYR